MPRLVARKFIHTIVVLLLVSCGVTFLINLAPGDPSYAILGDQASPDQVAQVHKLLGLDNPFYQRYWDWLKDLLRGDFGTSYISHQKASSVIVQGLPVTAELITVAFLMAMAVSIPIGIYCAYRAGGRFDRTWSVISSGLISVPPFLSALLLAYVFAVLLRNFPLHFPVTGWAYLGQGVGNNLYYAFLPALTLALALVPLYSRLLRADMIATLQEDYILAARARGVPPRKILLVHALKQSSFSLLTYAGISLGQLIGGAAIVEVVFAIPGLGQSLVNAIEAKDVPLVQGTVMFIAIAYVFLNLAVDLAYSYLDPRTRLGGAR